MIRLSALILGLLPALAPAADYHLAQDGDDAREGTSPATAWRSLERIPVGRLASGDRILLRGGDRFVGTLVLTSRGTSGQPITVASYGSGRAVIAPPPGQDALTLTDAAWIVVRDLRLIGTGPESAPARGCGLVIQAAQATVAGIVVRDVEAADFPQSGISVRSRADAGCRDVLIERVDCHGNALAGFDTGGPVQGTAYGIHHLVVRDSAFHDNRGRPAKTDGHSGSGIVLGSCADSLIERCAAWANGDLCNAKAGGPVGIWLWESTRTVIRGCVSYANRTGKGVPDGGGFDLDGGSSGCVVEDCLSWRNDGSGYMLCQYGGARPMTGNIIRNSWSVGDGRGRNNRAMITSGTMDGNLVANCTFLVDGSQAPVACWGVGSDSRDLHLRGNWSVALGAATLVAGTFATSTVRTGNRWSPADGWTLAPGEAFFAGEPAPQIPQAVTESWLAGLAIPPGELPMVESRWSDLARAAGCRGEFPVRIGATALDRYGPAGR